jgi:hypothetical protein
MEMISRLQWAWLVRSAYGGQHGQFCAKMLIAARSRSRTDRPHDAGAMFTMVLYLNAALRGQDCKVLAADAADRRRLNGRGRMGRRRPAAAARIMPPPG